MGILSEELQAVESKQSDSGAASPRSYTVEQSPIAYSDTEAFGTRRDDASGTLYVYRESTSSVSGKVTTRNVAPATHIAKAASVGLL